MRICRIWSAQGNTLVDRNPALASVCDRLTAAGAVRDWLCGILLPYPDPGRLIAHQKKGGRGS